MSKPESIKVDPWTEWPRQSFSIINDDFVHDKLATFKINSKGAKSTVNLKANIKADKGGLKLADEVKYWFGLPEGRAFYAKVKSSDYIKLQVDNGIVQKWNRKWNLYATLNLTKTLSNASLRVGANHLSPKCNSDNRLRVDFQDDKQNLTWYNRTVVTKDKFTFGNMVVFNITNQILSKTNFLLGYKVNDKIDAFVRVENNDYRKSQWNLADVANHFDSYRVDVVAKHDDKIKYGLEGVFRKKSGESLFNEALLVVQHEDKENKRTSKIRLSSKFDVSVSLKFPSLLFKDIATTVVGIHGSNLHNEKRSFKAGGQLEFNV